SAPLDGATHVRLLNHPAPLAFCLPGMRNLTVLSSGLVDVFEQDEFDAVLAHERAHLRGQHHLLLLAFRAWHDVLPWFPTASKAEGAVATLIELVADDDACRTVERAALARALRRVGSAWDDGLAFGQDSGFSTSASYGPRLARLEAPRDRIPAAARWLVLALSMVTVAFPASYLGLVLTRSW
ncbi:MAG: M56 family metallopeptidase, partial [Agromyces sp.]